MLPVCVLFVVSPPSDTVLTDLFVCVVEILKKDDLLGKIVTAILLDFPSCLDGQFCGFLRVKNVRLNARYLMISLNRTFHEIFCVRFP